MVGRLLSTGMIAVLLCALCLPTIAAAPSRKPVAPSVIAIVDVPRVLKLSKAAISVRGQLEKQRSKFQSQIAKEEAELRSAEKELIKLREAEDKEAFVALEQKLQKRFLKVERHVQSRRKTLDHAFAESMNTVRQNLVETVASIAKEKGVNLVVVKQQVIWNDTAIDITDEVLSRLDKVLPQVPVQILSDNAAKREKPFVIKR